MSYKATTQLPLRLFEPPKPTLENFFQGENALAVNILHKVMEGCGPQIVYLYGDAGVGKTHLLSAVVKHDPKLPEFQEERKVYAVDDVETLSEEDLQKLFQLITDVRAHPGTTVVIAGCFSPEELARQGFRKDITTRLGWGTVIHLQPLSSQERQREFLKRAEIGGLTVSPEVLSWMDIYLPRDMHTLTRLLERATQKSIVQNRPFTIPLLKECLAAEDRNE